MEPLTSVFLVEGSCEADFAKEFIPGEEIAVSGWRRSICEGAECPDFSVPVETTLPDGDALAEEKPEFSGFVRYGTAFSLEVDEDLCLKIEDASEGVEAFLNGESLGIQNAPPFLYRMTGKAGQNELVIEVATTLERDATRCLKGIGRWQRRSRPAPAALPEG